MRDDELDLFNASLLDRLANQRKENGLLVRPLRSTDYDKGNLFKNISVALVEIRIRYQG